MPATTLRAQTIGSLGKTITISADDPFQSLFTPSYEPGPIHTRNAKAFATAQIDANAKAQTFMTRDDERRLAQEEAQSASTLQSEYVPKEKFEKATKSSRDAWVAMSAMAFVAIAGAFWTAQRVVGDGEKIETLAGQVEGLTKQLSTERGVVIARNQEIKLLNQQLADVKKKATSARK
jgi:hypothetical protein